MAGEDLIASYLARVRALIGFRPDADAILAELEDHLRSGIEQRLRHGLDEAAAQQESVEVFGCAEDLALELCRSKGGGVALPTRLSRRGGLAALSAAGLVLMAVVPAYVRALEVLDGRNTGPGYYVMGLLLVLAGIASLVALVGALGRSGAGPGAGVVVALGVATLGIALVAVAPWSHPVTLALLWGPSVFGLICLAGGSALPSAVWATALSWPACAGALYLLDEQARLGAADQHGDYPWAVFSATAVFAGLWAVGQFALGRLLVSEQPVSTFSVRTVD